MFYAIAAGRKTINQNDLNNAFNSEKNLGTDIYMAQYRNLTINKVIFFKIIKANFSKKSSKRDEKI